MKTSNRNQSSSTLARLSRKFAVVSAFAGSIGVSVAFTTGGCPANPGGGSTPDGNWTDITNGQAKFVGSSACRNCHTDIASLHERHGHSFTLNRIQDGAPRFPTGTSAGVPNPPPGFDWSAISYVLGGYAKGATYFDQQGYVLSTGLTGVATQWNLLFPPNGTTAGFAEFESTATTPITYEYDRFVHETTGAKPQDPADPHFQENRPGFRGTWSEAGVQCEACHGPGSGHFGTSGGDVRIDTSRIFIDPYGTDTCRACHTRPFGDTSGAILAKDGYIQEHEQWAELQASGGHSEFSCTTCHDPHRSVTFDRANAIRNECTACHTDRNMAGHKGKVYTRADGYTEELTCASCHMTYATRSRSAATPAAAGPFGRIGDTRTHIFRISTQPIDFTGFFTADGSQVVRDADGRAAVTVDFVCIRCHNDTVPFPMTVERAAEIAGQVHNFPE